MGAGGFLPDSAEMFEAVANQTKSYPTVGLTEKDKDFVRVQGGGGGRTGIPITYEFVQCSDITNTQVGISGEAVPKGGNLRIC